MGIAKQEVATILPLEIIDKSVGKHITVLMTGEKEFTGKLVGFDDYVNLVLEDAVERDSEGIESQPMKKMLLNSAHVAMIVPQ